MVPSGAVRASSPTRSSDPAERDALEALLADGDAQLNCVGTPYQRFRSVGYCSARCSRCSGPLGVGDRGGGREHTATPELASAQTAASSRHAAPPLTPALCISLSTSSRTACNSSPRSSRPRSKPRCLARSTSCAAPLGRHFPHLGAGVWPGGGDRVQRADGLVKVAADRSRSRRRSARIAAPSSTALGRGGAHGAPRVEAPLGSFAQPGVAQGVLWAKILGVAVVSDKLSTDGGC